MRISIVQYAGDYREAFERLRGGGKETYQAQRYSVEFVGALARHHEVSVVCAITPKAYDEYLANGVRAVGAGLALGFRDRNLLPAIAKTTPDRLVLTTPLTGVLEWAIGERLLTLALLADSFEQEGLLTNFRYRKLARLLNRPEVQWVANHGISACLSLARIGTDPSKILPWDWPPSLRPEDFTPRQRSRGKLFRLLYVGSVTAAKGVGDLLRAVASARAGGDKISLTVVGEAEGGDMQDLAMQIGIADWVNFLGRRPHEEISGMMRAADSVIIPSRHEYPEGLPLTIYEALATRTPIIASDHPMFRGALDHGQTALIFPASNSERLALAIKQLNHDDVLYQCLSENAADAWQKLQLPVRWADLIATWVSSSPEGLEWMRDHALAAGHYAKQIRDRIVPKIRTTGTTQGISKVAGVRSK